jgi:hypothetical protein
MGRAKKDAYAALQRLMEEPGSTDVILEDFLHSIETDQKKKIARLMAGTPTYDDRGVAVIFGALLESALETAIATHFAIPTSESRRLFSYTDNGPLAEFSGKIAMGYALGVYEEHMHSDLKWISRIRNAFAHARVEVSFGTEAIVEACNQLKFPKHGAPAIQAPRQRFTVCVAFSAIHLLLDEIHPRTWKNSAPYLAMYGLTPSPEK